MSDYTQFSYEPLLIDTIAGFLGYKYCKTINKTWRDIGASYMTMSDIIALYIRYEVYNDIPECCYEMIFDVFPLVSFSGEDAAVIFANIALKGMNPSPMLYANLDNDERMPFIGKLTSKYMTDEKNVVRVAKALTHINDDRLASGIAYTLNQADTEFATALASIYAGDDMQKYITLSFAINHNI